MTEKEKMLSGLPYDAWDKTLLNDRMNAKAVCHKFNLADPTQLNERMAILKGLLCIKDQAHMEPNFFVTMAIILKLAATFTQIIT